MADNREVVQSTKTMLRFTEIKTQRLGADKYNQEMMVGNWWLRMMHSKWKDFHRDGILLLQTKWDWSMLTTNYYWCWTVTQDMMADNCQLENQQLEAIKNWDLTSNLHFHDQQLSTPLTDGQLDN